MGALVADRAWVPQGAHGDCLPMGRLLDTQERFRDMRAASY
jgi:hypothetical protein